MGLALERVAEIAYDIAVFTNLTHEHLDLHGTYEAYVAAKRSLFERLEVGPGNPRKRWPKGAVINAQDERGPEMAAAARAAGAQVVTYAMDPDVAADIVATSVHDDGRALRMHVRTSRWEDELHIYLAGRFNAFNALAAVGVGELLGLDPAAMRRGLGAVRKVSGRMEPIDEGQPFDVFVDFAHTPGALAAALDALAPVAAARGGSLISLFGSPGARDVAKRPMMGRAAGERSRIVVVTEDDPRTTERMAILEEIAAGAEEAGKRRGHDLFLIPDRRAAIRRALELARRADIVLLAGKGHEPTLALATGAEPWSEAGDRARGAQRDGLPRRCCSEAATPRGSARAGARASATAERIGDRVDVDPSEIGQHHDGQARTRVEPHCRVEAAQGPGVAVACALVLDARARAQAVRLVGPAA